MLSPNHTIKQRVLFRKKDFCIRPFGIKDRKEVYNLLSFLPSLYPGGDTWLHKRLDDVLEKKATCTIVDSLYGIVGISIETPKMRGTVKLSTIFIHPLIRGQNIGTKLLEASVTRWYQTGIRSSYVTVDANRYGHLEPLLKKYRFNYRLTEYDRYGYGRDEVILDWFA